MIARGMGPASGTLRGICRRGNAGGVLAVLAITLGMALPAFADDHGHHGGHDGQGPDAGAQQQQQPPGQQPDRGDQQQAPPAQQPPPQPPAQQPQPDQQHGSWQPHDGHGWHHGHNDPNGPQGGPPQQQPAEASQPQPAAPPAAGGTQDHGQQTGPWTGHHGVAHDHQAASTPAPEQTSPTRTEAATPVVEVPSVPVSESLAAAAPPTAKASTPAAAAPRPGRGHPRTGPSGGGALTRVAGARRGVGTHGGARGRLELVAQPFAPARWTPATSPLSSPLPAPAPAASAGHAASPGGHAGARPRHRQPRSALRFVPVVLRAIAGTIAVIPLAVWLAMAGLAVFGLLMGGVAFGRHRRARALGRERELLIADLHALEGAVVPTLPAALGGLALSVSTAPALGPASGGDFHDAFALSRDRVAVIVGDVAGHGRQALTDAQLVRHAIRAYLEAGLDPRGAIAMTATVVEERDEPLFASVIVAVHDRRDGTLTFASAGHEPPVFVTEHGAGLPPVSGWSPPLGTGLDTGRRQTTIPLPEGQAVCLMTDGVTEARSLGERIGVSRVIKWLSALGPTAAADDVAQRLHDETDSTEDDVTVFMLRALTPAAAGAARIEEAVVEGGDPTYLVRFLRDCGLPADDAEEAGAALAAAPDGTRMVASVEIRGGRAVVELAPLRGGSSHGTLVG